MRQKKSAIAPQIADASRRGEAGAEEYNPQAQDDHGNNRDDLDDGEPELHFSVGADVEEIDGCDDGKQYRR